MPWSPVRFAQREGRYHRYSRNLPCTVYFFQDETGALPSENLMLRMVRKLKLVTGEMDIDLKDVFEAAVK